MASSVAVTHGVTAATADLARRRGVRLRVGVRLLALCVELRDQVVTGACCKHRRGLLRGSASRTVEFAHGDRILLGARCFC